MPAIRIALLHLSPVLADVAGNQRRVETAVRAAAEAGADWAVTPEFATTGYSFAERIGTDWIAPQPDAWVRHMAQLARDLDIVTFLSVPERDGVSCFNSLVAIDRTGEVAGAHRKINTLRVGAEAWSSPGNRSRAVQLSGFGAVGMLICADACSPGIANGLAGHGARALVSSAAWAPGLYGPAGEWEAVSLDTGLPMFVANRTGSDPVLDFHDSSSVVTFAGTRVFDGRSAISTVFLIDWDFDTKRLVAHSELDLV